jgi:hypothetical protein
MQNIEPQYRKGKIYMTGDQSTQGILFAISKIEESRTGGWIHNSKLNISAFKLVELIDKKFIEAGGMYSRLTKHGKALAVGEN